MSSVTVVTSDVTSVVAVSLLPQPASAITDIATASATPNIFFFISVSFLFHDTTH